MEVHAHPHSPRKKWFHYFWEFFMMFAAISASFFVENKREHYVEGKKEKQYMVSLLADMKSDTQLLRKYTARNTALISGLGALFTLVKNYKSSDARKLYGMFDAYASWVLRARLSDRTISQLKNAGGMRLIHVQAISDSILVYEERKKLLVDQGEGYARANDNLTDLSGKILDYRYLLPLDTNSITSPQSFSPPVLFEFANTIKLLRDQIETYVGYLEELLGRATNLIKLIQKNYHLK